MLPKLACLCPTYNRRHLLPQALQSFLLQDYPADRCELIILDDAGQYVSQNHSEPKPWSIVSFNKRFRTMGEKRNCSASLVSRDVDALVLWDDDDIYLPWTLKAHAAALAKAPWSRPTRVYREYAAGKLDNRPTLNKVSGLHDYHACWAFTREVFSHVQGYKFVQSGQDRRLQETLTAAQVPLCDPLSFGYDPFFIFRWTTTGAAHLSWERGDNWYYKLGDQVVNTTQVDVIEPHWPVDFVALAANCTKKLK